MAAQNRLAFGFDGPYFKGIVQSFDAAITDEVFYNTWGVTKLPAGLDGKSYTVEGNSATAIFAASKHKKEAAKFVEFLANSDSAITEFLAPFGYLPAAKSAISRFPNLYDNPMVKAFFEEINPTMTYIPYGPNYVKAASILSASMQELITVDKPVQEILDAAQTKLEGVILGK
ncbi:MAG: extracellular solute-binding protein [Actinobacteria bacterium]|nr:extracellular solute-binding protein [Actinomycetota bacterium]